MYLITTPTWLTGSINQPYLTDSSLLHYIVTQIYLKPTCLYTYQRYPRLVSFSAYRWQIINAIELKGAKPTTRPDVWVIATEVACS